MLNMSDGSPSPPAIMPAPPSGIIPEPIFGIIGMPFSSNFNPGARSLMMSAGGCPYSCMSYINSISLEIRKGEKVTRRESVDCIKIYISIKRSTVSVFG
jgi:hypothetical protein